DISEKLSIDVSFPVTVGLSGDDYYVDATGDDEFFGYVSFGPMIGVPLNFIPEEYGSWSASAGVLFYYLNDDAGLTDTGEDFEVVGIFGISMEY
ncbi:MAG: hypothetical protein MI741_23530, partial [Rhodospirillales bacterium]|nr:hypothetical protein [Rhodospirillales bacterium]